MANLGQTDTSDLVVRIRSCGSVSARLALVADGDRWRLLFGEITLDDGADEAAERTWRYSTAAFLERRLPGRTAAALLDGQPQDIDDFSIDVPAPQSSTAATQRLRGQELWGRLTTPWPRTEWTISRDSSTPQTGHDVLVGDGPPSFLNFDQALSAFLYQRPHDNNAGRSEQWRIIWPQRAGWLRQITVAPDLLTVAVEGDDLPGAVLGLSAPASHEIQAVDTPGTYTFKLPEGLADDSMLMLRRGDQWLDMRHFPNPLHGRTPDVSVVYEQPPGPELVAMLAAGEGQHLELKREVPPKDSEHRRKMLKTVAAFASQPGGGTILIGVRDDLQIAGLPETSTVDEQNLQVVGMIRDNIEPVPPYTTRPIEHEGAQVLAVEVTWGRQMYSYRNDKTKAPDFYIRIGPNTVLARHHEIAAGFLQPQSENGA
jgi:hypothetical protein